MKWKFSYVLCFFAILILSSTLHSQTSALKTIAVLDLNTRGAISPAEAGTLTDRLRSMLVRTNKLNVLERGKMEEILREVGLQQTGCTSTECIVEAGKMLSVELMVSGSVGKIGQLYTVDVVLIDVETSRILKSITRDYRGEIEGLLDLMEPIATQLTTFIETEITKPLTTGSLNITTTPATADILLNENIIGKSPYKIDNLLPGEYTLKLIAEGYAPIEDKIKIEKGETTEYNADLKKIITVRINSIPTEAALTIDNQAVGKTPYIQKCVERTRLDLKIKKENYVDWVKQEFITSDTTITARLDFYGGSLNISTIPPAADIFLDNNSIGKSPLNQDKIAPGEHKLKVTAEGYLPLEEKIHIEVGKSVARQFSLVKLCTVNINSTPAGAQVFIDNRPVGVTPYRHQVTPGTRVNVKVSQRKYHDWQQDFTVTGEINVMAELKAKSKKWLWIGGGTTLAVGAAATIIFWVDKGSEKGDTGFPKPPGRP